MAADHCGGGDGTQSTPILIHTARRYDTQLRVFTKRNTKWCHVHKDRCCLTIFIPASLKVFFSHLTPAGTCTMYKDKFILQF